MLVPGAHVNRDNRLVKGPNLAGWLRILLIQPALRIVFNRTIASEPAGGMTSVSTETRAE